MREKSIWKILAILIVLVMVGSCAAVPSAGDVSESDRNSSSATIYALEGYNTTNQVVDGTDVIVVYNETYKAYINTTGNALNTNVPLSSSSNTSYVSDDYTTIQTAVNNASTGDTIISTITEDKNLGDSIIEIATSGESKKLIHADAVPGEVIVGFKKGITALEQRSIIIEKYNGEILERESALNAVLVHVSNVQACISKITKEKAVEYAQPNYITKALFSIELNFPQHLPKEERDPLGLLFTHIPNDPLWNEQYNLRLIEVDYDWKHEKGNKSIKVAIVDTGIQYAHPDLKGNYVLGGYDWVNDDSDPYDDNGHGTHCAGIVAAVIDNKEGIAGIAQVSLMAEKVLDEKGEGSVWHSARGITHAADEGANIISLSLGSYSYSPIIENACQYAWNAGCLLISGSGNDGTRSIEYPARFDTVIAVGAIDKNLQRWSDSNYGPELELVAPGVEVISTYLGNDYVLADGTSVAAPHVAGVAALIWSESPSLTNHQIRYMLQHNAIDLGTTGWDEYYGYGLVNVVKYLSFEESLYVPDNYTTIQDAVTALNHSFETVVVRDGIYKENVDMRTANSSHLTIESENGSTNCIVQAVGDAPVFSFIKPALTFDYFESKSVWISGLTITRVGRGSGDGIYLGVRAGLSSLSSIIVISTVFHDISNNNCTNHRYGIGLYYNLFDTISNNICSNNEVGIFLCESCKNRIFGNTFSNNKIGISLYDSNNNNRIYFNNFINNTNNVHSYKSTNTWNSEEKISYNYNGNAYTNYVGNYWNDYNGTDADGDGIGDAPYIINSDNKDLYPLIMPFEYYQTSTFLGGNAK